MRLSSGSGLDGLSSIAPMSWMKDVAILRPFYDCSHVDLITYCKENKVQWIEDPSNDQDKYKRVRFRKAQDFLTEEGLTSKRLSKTIERMARARDALDQMTVFMLDQLIIDYSDEECGLDLKAFYDLHLEFQIRAVLMVIERLVGVTAYPPRLEKLEGLVHDLGRSSKPFRKRTFAGCVFEVKPKDNVFIISIEKR
ncbi:MAG: ATP-binding protein, partial [Bdellovibrionales bacterium]